VRAALVVAALAPLAVASVSERVWAQATPCPVEETVADCIARLEGRAPLEPVARSAAAVQQRLRARSTGFGLEGLGALGSAISDFLPLFAGMLGGDTENADQTIAADVNLRLDFNPATPGSQVIRGRVIRHAPTVYQSVVNAFPDSVRVARVVQLQEALNEFDDVEVRAAFNLETGTFGRTFGQHRRLWGALFTEIIADAEREAEAGPDPAIEAGRFLNDLADGDFVEGCDPDEAGDIQVLTLRCLRRGPRSRNAAEPLDERLAFVSTTCDPCRFPPGPSTPSVQLHAWASSPIYVSIGVLLSGNGSSVPGKPGPSSRRSRTPCPYDAYPAQGRASYFEPAFDGSHWLVNAQNQSGFAPEWKLRVRVVCAAVGP